MYSDYSDIIDRLGEPLWYDEHGTPRYEPFHPRWADPYIDYVALLEVECQWCGRHMQVASAISMLHERIARREFEWAPELPHDGRIGHFHYGDAPFHRRGDGERCPGETMNTIPMRVLEFWRRDRDALDWVRDPSHEIVMSDNPFGFGREDPQP